MQGDSENRDGGFARRIILIGLMLAMLILSGSCASLVKSTDYTIPKILTPLADAKFEDMVKQLQPFTEVQSLVTSQANMQFKDATASEKYRFDAESTIVLQRPDKIRMRISAGTIGVQIVDMVSESNHFRVAIYFPSDYRHFILGTNNADYSEWLQKLPVKEKESALSSARPFHFTEALMMRPLALNDPRFVFGMEETLVEEADTRPAAKKGARVLHSYYVITETEVSPEGQVPAHVRRKFWFDRANGAQFARQQIFDQQGQLTTEVTYSNYKKLNPGSQSFWPGEIWVNRPHDGYMARLKFDDEKFQINTELSPTAFTLENTDNLPVTDLDRPAKKP